MFHDTTCVFQCAFYLIMCLSMWKPKTIIIIFYYLINKLINWWPAS